MSRAVVLPCVGIRNWELDRQLIGARSRTFCRLLCVIKSNTNRLGTSAPLNSIKHEEERQASPSHRTCHRPLDTALSRRTYSDNGTLVS